MAKVKARKSGLEPEVYRPSVFLDGKQVKGLKEYKPGQRVQLSGIVVSKTTRVKRGERPQNEVSVEIKKISKKKK